MRKSILAAIILVILFPFSSFAQKGITTNNQTGIPFGTTIEGQNENINLATGNLNVSIPLYTVQARGFGFPINITYDSKIWQCHAFLSQAVVKFGWSKEETEGFSIGLWRLSIPHLSAQINQRNPTNGLIEKWADGFILTMPDGSKHGWDKEVSLDLGSHTGGTRIADSLNDNDHLRINLTNASNITVRTTDGTIMYFEAISFSTSSGKSRKGLCTKMVDRNGNVITFTRDQVTGEFTGIKDSAGRTVLQVIKGSPTTTLRVNTSTGTADILLTTYEQNLYTINAEFFKPVFPGTTSLKYPNVAIAPLQSITLPNGQQYEFLYDATEAVGANPSFGHLTKVIYPAVNSNNFQRGFSTYTYRRFLAGQKYDYDDEGFPNSRSEDTDFYEVTSRTINDGQTSYTTSYEATIGQENSNLHYASNSSVIVNNPDGHSSKHTFFNVAAINPPYPYEKITEYYEGANATGALRMQIEYDYALAIGLWTSKTTTVYGINPADDRKKKETREYDSYQRTDEPLPRYFTDITKTEEFDWILAGQSFPSTSLRRTSTIYKKDYNSNDLWITGLPLSTTVYVSSETNFEAKTEYEYDIYNTSAGHDILKSYSSIVGHNTTTFNTNYITRGNVTKVTRHTGSTLPTILTYNHYDIAGNVVAAIDGKGNKTTISYSDNYYPSNPDNSTYAYPTSVSSPAPNPLEQPQTVSTQYYLNNGQVYMTTDANSVSATFSYNNMGAPVSITRDPGTIATANRTSITYDYLSGFVTKSDDLNSIDDGKLSVTIYIDGLGKTIRTEQQTPTGTVKSEQTYDSMGRVSKSTNPFYSTSDSTYGYTTFQYDALGRTTLVEKYAGSIKVNTITNTYSAMHTRTAEGDSTKFTARVTKVDGLGRMTSIWEEVESADANGPSTVQAPISGSSSYETTYEYNTLDNLTKIIQGSQQRVFTYDKVSRLLSSTSPEHLGAATNYTYDDNGNLTKKRDPKGVETNFTYDALSRVKIKTYSFNSEATQAVNYFYDNQAVNGPNPPSSFGKSIGRLKAVTTDGISGGQPATGYYYSYDNLGRIDYSYQVIDGPTGTRYEMKYGYNLAGQQTSIKYPTNKEVITAYDDAGRVVSVKDGKRPYTNIGINDYAANGAVTSQKLGNGLTHSISYNGLFQPTTIKLAKGTTDLGKLDYTYESPNNGNVATITVTHGATQFVQNYEYDKLDRLKVARETSGGATNWKQTFRYDRYGNRFVVGGEGNTTFNVLPPELDFDPLTNRISTPNYIYDANGNLTNESGVTSVYSYDAENRIVTASKQGSTVGTYFYDGNGKRIKTESSGVTRRMIYDAAGNIIVEYEGSTPALSKEYIYGPTGLLATLDVVCETGGGTNKALKYIMPDHLGSGRVITNNKGEVVSRHDYLPFGEEIGVGVGARTAELGFSKLDKIRQKFTGYERDSETGLDFAKARYFGSGSGRFMSPDPLLASGSDTDPQSWNRYTYTLNNPLKFVDPSGLLTDKPKRGKKSDDKKPEIIVVDPIPIIVEVRPKPETLNPFAQGVINELSRSARASKRIIFGFGLGTGIIGGGVGGAVFLSGGAFGSAITTLGTLGRVATPLATGGTVVLDQLGKTDKQIFTIALEKGLSATNSFLNNLSALTEAVRTKVPDGQLNYLGNIGNSPIYGSLRSGVGIAEVEGVTVVVKVAQGAPQILGPLPK